MWKFTIPVGIFLFFFLLLSHSAFATNPTLYSCDHPGDTGGSYNSGTGSCNSDEVCDNLSPNTLPCVKISALKCTCKGTGGTDFTCGVNGSTNDFTRSCGLGEVCSNSVLSQAGHTSPWPCTNNINATNAPTGTIYNPCPNGICDTSLGPIGVTDPAAFVAKLFQILLSLSGAVALLLIIVAGYQLMISQGNPEKVKAARERLVSAVVGLLFIIFSVAFLQIIGVDILHLPGFKP